MPKPDLQARKQQAVRDAILDAALELFARKGFDRTTVDDVAEAAGVSRRSFFRYFDSKAELMTGGIVNYAATLAQTIDSFPARHPLPQVFRGTILRVAEHSAADPRTRLVMNIAAKYPEARNAQLARVAELQDRVAEAYARRCRANDRVTPGVLTSVTLSMLSVAIRTWFECGGDDIRPAVEKVLRAAGRVFSPEPSR